MKITKLLPTLGALSTIAIAAPIFGSCAKNEPIDEWIDATVKVDTTGFKKIKGIELSTDKALEIYKNAISSDLSILENDIKWGCKTIYDYEKEEWSYSFISAIFLYKISDVEFDLKTETVSFCFSEYYEWNTNSAPDGYDYYTRLYDFDVKINKMPLLIDVNGPLGLMITVDIMKTDNWTNESYINVDGLFAEGSVKNKVVTPDQTYLYDDVTINKQNYDDFSWDAMIPISALLKWPSYYFSDCNKDPDK